MIALPSIAFGGFSGSAKGVTARYQDGRSILSLKCYPTGEATILQLARRTSLKKITKTWPMLTDQQRQDWERLAEHANGQSVFGQKAKLSGINLYVRLNANRQMAGEELLADAPAGNVAAPNVEYSNIYVTPDLVAITGIRHKPAPFKLVVKMSACQSPGVSNGWNKTVIISGDTEDDWGEADVTELYLNKIGVAATPGQKVFVETYWLDTETGFTGQIQRDSVICEGEAPYTRRVRATMDSLDPEADFSVVERHFPALFGFIMKNLPERFGLVYNLNFPAVAPEAVKGIRITSQGVIRWVREYTPFDPGFYERRGLVPHALGIRSIPDPEPEEDFFVMGGTVVKDPDNGPETDVEQIAQGYITLTAHTILTTDDREQARLRDLGAEQLLPQR